MLLLLSSRTRKTANDETDRREHPRFENNPVHGREPEEAPGVDGL